MDPHDLRRWSPLWRRLIASDRLWIFASSVVSRVSNFGSNLILARYGGPAVLGTYSAIQSTATAVTSPVLWSLSTSATLETRSAPDELGRRTVIAAHLCWALLIACVSSAGFLILQYGFDGAGEAASRAALGTITGLLVVIGTLVTGTLQAALHGAGVYKPTAARLAVVSLVCVLVAIPAVLALELVGALLALSLQSVLLAAALASLARPSHRDRARVTEAFRAARRQLVRGVPNVVALFISAGAHWLVTIYLIHRSHGIAGVGVFAVGVSWLTIEMMAVTAWGGLSLRVLGDAHASSPAEFTAAVRRVLAKDLSFTMAIAVVVFACADPLARLYGMADTPLPTILRVSSVTALVMAANQVIERAMFCAGQQQPWMHARVAGDLCMLGLALWLVPMRLEYAAIAKLCGYAGTTAMCVSYRARARRLRPS